MKDPGQTFNRPNETEGDEHDRLRKEASWWRFISGASAAPASWPRTVRAKKSIEFVMPEELGNLWVREGAAQFEVTVSTLGEVTAPNGLSLPVGSYEVVDWGRRRSNEGACNVAWRKFVAGVREAPIKWPRRVRTLRGEVEVRVTGRADLVASNGQELEPDAYEVIEWGERRDSEGGAA